MASTPDVSCVVVTHNNAALVERCLRAARAAVCRRSAEVVVVDNASTDGTAERARAADPAATVIALSRNVGFASANNLGIDYATGRFVVLLNSDCFPDPDALDRLVDAAESHPEGGLFGGQLRYEDGRAQQGHGPLPTLRSELAVALGLRRLEVAPSTSRETGWVSAAMCLARRESCPLPVRSFLYGEEVDWAAAVRRGGKTVRIEPQARAVHIGRASVGPEFGDGFSDRRRVELVLSWFGDRGALVLAAARAILVLHAVVRLVAGLGLCLVRPAQGWALVRRFGRYLGFAVTLRPSTDPPPVAPSTAEVRILAPA